MLIQHSWPMSGPDTKVQVVGGWVSLASLVRMYMYLIGFQRYSPAILMEPGAH